MPNYKIQDNSIEFKINGADKFTSFIIIIFLIVITVIIFIFAVVLAENNYFFDNPILSAVILLSAFIFLLFLLLYIVKIGIFARYLVKLDTNIIEIYDKRNDIRLMSNNINKDNFYIADARQQAGYASIKVKAFCYGPLTQIFVEDRPPDEDFILFAIGRESKIKELELMVISIITK